MHDARKKNPFPVLILSIVMSHTTQAACDNFTPGNHYMNIGYADLAKILDKTGREPCPPLLTVHCMDFRQV